MKVRFTPNQELAYKAVGRNVLVSAGAGSGKTQVLSERVRYLVEEKNFKINEFLILTFTRLAALEMKSRIKAKLIAINSSEAKYVDDANITTFDSYAFSIVKKYHTLLGLDSNISIIDNSVITIITKNIIDQIFEEHYQSDQFFNEFANRFSFMNNDEIKKAITDLYQKAIDYYSFDKYFELIKANSNMNTCYSFLAKVNNDIDVLFDNIETSLTQISDEKYQDKFQKIITKYKDANSIEEKITVFDGTRLPSSSNVEEKDQVEIIKNSVEKIKKYKDYFSSEKDFFDENEINYSYVTLMINICYEIKNRVDSFKKEKQTFTFQDIAKMALSLLREHVDVADKIKNSLKTIMIDEYQDTSTIQEEFISLISNNNVYMVGDVKQSIYRFRNATPEIFIKKFQSYKNNDGGELISLNKNFRSREEVLDDINKLFSKIMTLDLGGADYLHDHLIIAGNSSYNDLRVNNYHSDVLSYSIDGDKSEIEARIIAQDILEKMNSKYQIFDNGKTRDMRLSDVCIILDRGVSFSTYQKVFKEYKIPLFIENNVDISNNQIVLMIKNLFNLLQCILNNDYTTSKFKHAFYSIAKGYVFNLKDDEIYNILNNQINDNIIINTLREAYNASSNKSIYEFILFLVDKLDIYQKIVSLGDVKIYEKYLDNFLEVLKNLHQLNYNLEDYILYFDKIDEFDLKIEIPSSTTSFDAVKMMNIFKSKGLEFPIVYCSGLYKSFNQTEKNNKFGFSFNYGIIFPTIKLKQSLMYRYFFDEMSQEDLSEKIRLLYVQLTRAKEKIIFVLPDNLKEKDVEDSKSLGHLISKHLDLFNVIAINEITDNVYYPKLTKIEYQNLDYENINIDSKIKQKANKASKDISLDAKSEVLNLGSKLHLDLEIIDFLKPNFDFIDNKYELKLIKSFISSEYIKNLKNPIFYKEYQFIDEINNTKGIIDLLIVDEEQIYIIDYKLKNIDDEKYVEQLRVYFNFVWSYFKKKSICILYSLIDQEGKIVNI